MSKKSQVPVTLVLVFMIGVMGFKDTGIFVREFKAEDSSHFKQGETIEIVSESKENFLVEKSGKQISVPKDSMIIDEKTSSTYKIVNDSSVYTKVGGEKLGNLKVGELVQAEKLNGIESVFKTKDGIEGFINLGDLEKVNTESITMGISTVNKTLKNKGQSHMLLKGDPVKIKSFENNKYIVLGMEGEEYSVPENYIKLSKNGKVPTRGASSRRNESVNKIVSSAHKQLGRPYVSGDTGRKGFDCSGLTYYLYSSNLNIKLPRSSRDQAKAGTHVNKSDLLPGDLVFFKTGGSGIGHVGLYIGDNKMIHASTGQRKMIITDINSSYFAKRYVTARRIIN